MIDQTCDECNGRGSYTKLDLALAKTVKKACPKCKGTGTIPADMIENGVVFFVQKCQVGIWQVLRDKKPISSLIMYTCPVIDKYGNDMFTIHKDPKNPLAKPVAKGRYFIQIANMHTKPKYRKQGHMSALFDIAFGDPKIEWVETDWDDSTADGRNFLLSRGFNQVKGKLVKILKDYNAGNNSDTNTGSEEQASS